MHCLNRCFDAFPINLAVTWQVSYLNIICLKSPVTYRHVRYISLLLSCSFFQEKVIEFYGNVFIRFHHFTEMVLFQLKTIPTVILQF